MWKRCSNMWRIPASQPSRNNIIWNNRLWMRFLKVFRHNIVGLQCKHLKTEREVLVVMLWNRFFFLILIPTHTYVVFTYAYSMCSITNIHHDIIIAFWLKKQQPKNMKNCKYLITVCPFFHLKSVCSGVICPSTVPLNWGNESQQNKLWVFFPWRQSMIGSHQVFGSFD